MDKSEKRSTLLFLIGVWFASIAVQDQSLKVLDWNYSVNIPIVNHVIKILEQINGWGGGKYSHIYRIIDCRVCDPS
jgi:hypothetical protein